MFFLSVRAEKRRLLFSVLSVALIASMLIALIVFPASRTMISSASLQNEEEIAAYLLRCGCTVSLPPAEVREVCLPDRFEGHLADYEALQQQAGFSLAAYAGQPVICHTYALIDHESGDGAAVHLYLLDDRPIGGDITTADGTLLPLYNPSSERT